MPDYDVEARALSSPPSTGPATTYRPSVTVRNNGLHDALASGILRIYTDGRLSFVCEIFSGTIAPGAQGEAQATTYWTPDEGNFLVTADITSPLDMVESNNHVPPTPVVITGEAPPTPPPVAPHAAQHEEGGDDELSIDGLVGLTKDPQTPRAHAASHQAGGNDMPNVSGLSGTLSDPQTPANHGNERHTNDFALDSALDTHAGAAVVHSTSTNLAKLELSGPQTGLVPTSQLATATEDGLGRWFLGKDRMWQIPVPTGLICVWDQTNPIPTGWETISVGPALTLPHVWIVKVAPD